MQQFLDLIYAGSEGYIDIVTRSEEGELDSERWFSWPSERSFVTKYCETRADEDVYCSVSVFSTEHRIKDDPDAITHTVYADADTCVPGNFRLPPSIAVQTSSGHWHCWWILDEAVPAREAAEASHRVAKAHLAQGCDKSGWIQSKLLRVPNTSNTKRGTPEPVEATYSGEVYTLDTINAVYADINIAPEVILDAEQPMLVSKATRIKLEQQLDAAGLSDLYLQRPKDGQSWSERLFKLELELFRLGMTPQEVFSLARESACNKYAPENAGQRTQQGDVIPKRGDPDGVLWRDVQKAHVEYLTTSVIAVEEMVAPHETKRAEFLSVDERRYCIDNPTFIDQYVNWVASRTDSAETYQRSLAWMLLSCVFGGRGTLPLSWENTELNLWVLILGDTTGPRKTTAKNLFMRVLHNYESQSGMLVDIGSETTAEGLVLELGKRDGMVSVLHRDEIQGFFSEMLTKNYRVGTLETLTALYDGQVPVVLRATKDSGNKNRARTIFNFVGVGVRKRTAAVLTKDYFESGFLARMLWSVADPKPRRKGSEDLQLNEPDVTTNRYDGGLDDIVTDLIARVQEWPPEEPVEIWWDKAALNRYNRWAEEAMQIAERYGDGDIIVPAYQRMKMSIAKAATLLAMYEQSHVVTLPHFLAALQQAEFWFNDMVRMASAVSSSEFERRLDDVESAISGGKERSALEASVRRKFARLRPREIDEVFAALKAQGRIRTRPGQKLEAL